MPSHPAHEVTWQVTLGDKTKEEIEQNIANHIRFPATVQHTPAKARINVGVDQTQANLVIATLKIKHQILDAKLAATPLSPLPNHIQIEFSPLRGVAIHAIAKTLRQLLHCVVLPGVTNEATTLITMSVPHNMIDGVRKQLQKLGLPDVYLMRKTDPLATIDPPDAVVAAAPPHPPDQPQTWVI